MKRPGEHFAKIWSDQKMTVKEVVVLYGTYQKYIMFEALTLHGFKKNGTYGDLNP